MISPGDSPALTELNGSAVTAHTVGPGAQVESEQREYSGYFPCPPGFIDASSVNFCLFLLGFQIKRQSLPGLMELHRPLGSPHGELAGEPDHSIPVL